MNLNQGKQYLKQGNRAAAAECFQKAVDVTPLMAALTIQALKAYDVECIVAPYEADAQLTFLALQGFPIFCFFAPDEKSSGKIGAVVSEDSDLLPFGCQRVMYKMDKNGKGEEIRGLKTWIGARGMKIVSTPKWDQETFMQMCVLSGITGEGHVSLINMANSGCDYLPSLNGMGVIKANQVVNVVQQKYTGPSSTLFQAVSLILAQ